MFKFPAFSKLGILLLATASVMSACKETDTTPPPAIKYSSQNHILKVERMNYMPSDSVKYTIDTLNGKVDVLVPFDTDLFNASLSITCSPKATLSPSNWAVKNYSQPVAYRVVAENGSIKNYEVKYTCRPQLPLSINYYAVYGGGNAEASMSTSWDDTIRVHGENLLEFRKDEQGNPVPNVVTLINTATKRETSFTPPYVHDSRAGHKTLKITVPEGMPVGTYQLKCTALSKEVVATNKLAINYPSPIILEHPLAMKVGSTITISGKYFTNTPLGNNFTPRLRLYKGTATMYFEGQEFEIISFTPTSVTAVVKGFSNPDYEILQGEIWLQVYNPHDGFWSMAKDYRPITLQK